MIREINYLKLKSKSEVYMEKHPNGFKVFKKLAVEKNQRSLKQAVSAIEAIGDQSTILQISSFMKSEDALQGQVILTFI